MTGTRNSVRAHEWSSVRSLPSTLSQTGTFRSLLGAGPGAYFFTCTVGDTLWQFVALRFSTVARLGVRMRIASRALQNLVGDLNVSQIVDAY